MMIMMKILVMIRMMTIMRMTIYEDDDDYYDDYDDDYDDDDDDDLGRLAVVKTVLLLLRVLSGDCVL